MKVIEFSSRICGFYENCIENPSIWSFEDQHTPRYWENVDNPADFDTRHDVPQAFHEQLQKLLDQTFKDKKTRDRKGGAKPRNPRHFGTIVSLFSRFRG